MDSSNDSHSSSGEDEVSGPTEEELEAIFAEMHVLLAEMEKEREERELQRWLAEWKVLTDAGEAWLREQGYADEVAHVECFEELLPGEEVDSDVETVQLPEEDEDEDEDNGDGGGYGGGGYGGDGGGGGSGWGGSGGGATGS